MNPKHDTSRHLIVTKNTPISLSQLLGQKVIPANPFRPKRYIITLKPRQTAINSDIKNKSATPSSSSEIRKVIITAADLFKAKSKLNSNLQNNTSTNSSNSELRKVIITAADLFKTKSKPNSNFETNTSKNSLSSELRKVIITAADLFKAKSELNSYLETNTSTNSSNSEFRKDIVSAADLLKAKSKPNSNLKTNTATNSSNSEFRKDIVSAADQLKAKSKLNPNLETNTATDSSNSEFRKIIVSAADLLKGKSMFASPIGLRNNMLEKIDEQSEGSSTSIESSHLDLKLARPSTDIQRLRGGCKRRKSKSRERRLEGSTTEKDLNCKRQPGMERDQQEKAKMNGLYKRCECEKHKEPEKAKIMSDIKQEFHRCECKECKEKNLRYKTLPELKKVELKKIDIIPNIEEHCDCKKCKENSLTWKNFPELKIDESRKAEIISDKEQHFCKCECKECKERNLASIKLPELKKDEFKKLQTAYDKEHLCKCECKECKERNLVSIKLPEFKKDEHKKAETACDSTSGQIYTCECIHYRNEPKKRKCRCKCKCKCKCNIFKRKRSPKNKTVSRQEIPDGTTVCYCKSSPSPLNSETCSRIDNVEKQLEEMSTELSELRKEMLDPHDYFKIKFLSEQFREVNELLMELKINCSKLCNIQRCTNGRASLNVLEIQQPLKDLYVDQYKLKKLLESDKYFVGDYDALNKRSTCSSSNDQHSVNHNLLPLESSTCQAQAIQYNQNMNSSNPGCEITTNQQYYNNNRPRSSSGQELEPPSPLLSDVIGRGCVFVELPVVTTSISQSIWQIIGDYKSDNISITVILESNHLYHINVSVLHTGQSLGCIYATETALNQALTEHFFDNFSTFFVLNSNNSVQERNKMLSHSFEFMNSNNSKDTY